MVRDIFQLHRTAEIDRSKVASVHFGSSIGAFFKRGLQRVGAGAGQTTARLQYDNNRVMRQWNVVGA